MGLGQGVDKPPTFLSSYIIFSCRISHVNGHDADGPQAYKMKMPGEDFHIKCMNEPQYEEIFERAFSWFECELPVRACFNKSRFIEMKIIQY